MTTRYGKFFWCILFFFVIHLLVRSVPQSWLSCKVLALFSINRRDILEMVSFAVYRFLRDKNSAAYLQFRSLVLKYRSEDGNSVGDAAVKLEPGFHDEGKGFLMQKREFPSFTSQPPPMGLGFVRCKPEIKQETFKQETESENAYEPDGKKATIFFLCLWAMALGADYINN